MARTPLFHWMSRMIRSALEEVSEPPPVASGLSQEPRISPPATSPEDPSRRDFLKKTWGAAGTLATLSLLKAPALAQPFSATMPSNAMPPRPTTPSPIVLPAKTERVNIIGGGLGGLVTAYRLQQHGVPCALYEGSQRLGGRVFTRAGFNDEGMFVELGGELIDTGHADLIALCAELELPLEAFASPGPDTLTHAGADLEPAIFYSQGQVFTEAEVLMAFQPLALALANDLKKCFPEGEIRLPTYNQPYQAAELDHLSLAEYLHRQRHVASGWVLRLIAAAYTGEYGLDPEEQSALNLLLLIGTDTGGGFRMFGDSDEAMRIRGGNSRLVDALSRAIQPHVPIHLGHRLKRLDWRKDQLQLGFSVGGQFHWEASGITVLALPFSSLRHVSGLARIGLSPLKLRCISSWGYGTNSKQMMGFQSRFWQMHSPPASAGVRQITPSAPPSTGEIFTDLSSQCYWDSSRLQAGKAGILTNFIGGKAGRTATEHQWQTALHDLKPLFGDLENQQDGRRAFFNWHKHPWTQGSYTCPRPGHYTTLMGAGQEPELNDRLFFAGEHCSLNFAGYMNGAVKSGNTAARQISEKFSQTAVFSRLGIAATL